MSMLQLTAICNYVTLLILVSHKLVQARNLVAENSLLIGKLQGLIVGINKEQLCAWV